MGGLRHVPPSEEGVGRLQESEVENTTRTCPTESSKAHMGSQSLRGQARGLRGSVLDPPCVFSLVCLWDSSNCCGSRVSLTLFLLLGLFSFCWVALSSLGVGAFASLNCILFIVCVWLLSLGGLLFSDGRWRGSENGGQRGCWGKLGGVEGGKIVAGMFCLKEESIFNFKKGEKKNIYKTHTHTHNQI